MPSQLEHDMVESTIRSAHRSLQQDSSSSNDTDNDTSISSTTNAFDSTTNSTDSACSSAPQNLTLVVGSFFSLDKYLDYHIANYQRDNPHITVTLEQVEGDINDLQSRLIENSDSDNPWIGSIFPSQITGQLVQAQVLQPGSNGNNDDVYNDMLPFVKNHIALYDRQAYVLPLDGDALHLFYRKDLFEQYNQKVPRTWDEYTAAAKFFHQLGEDANNSTRASGVPLYGSCLSRVERCGNTYWTSLILSSMTQAQGTASGYLIDPVVDPDDPNNRSDPKVLFGEALQETLRYTAEQIQYGHPNERRRLQLDDEDACLATNFAFNRGQCAMTINWGNQLRGLEATPFKVGVAPTPGSAKVLDRGTSRLQECTLETCPYGKIMDDNNSADAADFIVNQAPYAAFGGWSAGVSSSTFNSKEQQNAMADFFAYLSDPKQSIQDVLPNSRSNFVQPYRYSHLHQNEDDNPWVQQAGYDATLIEEFTDAIMQMNSLNTVTELRVPQAAAIRNAIDSEIVDYIGAISDNRTNADDSELREDVTKQMENRIRAVIQTLDQQNPQQPPFLESYQRSFGTYVAPPIDNNYIMSSFRFAGWGLTGLTCGAAILCLLISLSSHKHRVIRAWQPFTLVQCCVGLFLMTSTIAFLSLDESLVSSTAILDTTCMFMPWTYVIGFTLLISAIYAKIIRCRELRQARQTPSTIEVDFEDSLQLTCRLLLVNGVVLSAWTLTDPLLWVREELPGATSSEFQLGDTFGACRGGDSNLHIAFMAILFVFNLCICTAAIIHGFQSRRLAFEFKENHWLPLILFPFTEAWIIGAPTLVLVKNDPSGTFVVMTAIVTVSSMGGLLALFAPIEWYIRKHDSTDDDDNSTRRLTSFGKEKEIRDIKLRIDVVASDNDRIQQEIAKIRKLFREDDADSEDFKKPLPPPVINKSRSLEPPVSVASRSAIVDTRATEEHLVMQDLDDDDDEERGSIMPQPPVPQWNIRTLGSVSEEDIIFDDEDDNDDVVSAFVPSPPDLSPLNSSSFEPSYGRNVQRALTPDIEEKLHAMTEPIQDSTDGSFGKSAMSSFTTGDISVDDGETSLPPVPMPEDDMYGDSRPRDAFSLAIHGNYEPVDMAEDYPKTIPALNVGTGSSFAAYDDSPASTPSRPQKLEPPMPNEESNAVQNRTLTTVDTRSSPSSDSVASSGASHMFDPDSFHRSSPTEADFRPFNSAEDEANSSNSDPADDHQPSKSNSSLKTEPKPQSKPKDEYTGLEAALFSDNLDEIDATVAMLAASIKQGQRYKTVASPEKQETVTEIKQSDSSISDLDSKTLPFEDISTQDDLHESHSSQESGSEQLPETIAGTPDSNSYKNATASITDTTAASSIYTYAVSDRSESLIPDDNTIDSDLVESPESFKTQSTTGESSAAEVLPDNTESNEGSVSDSRSTGSPIPTQNAGEPSGGDVLTETVVKTPPMHDTKPEPISLEQESTDVYPPQEPKGLTFTLGDWSAVGPMASMLADSSDSQSCSSYSSYDTKTSTSSMGATRSASDLDTILANELDALVGKKDWEGVRRAAAKYETSRLQLESARNTNTAAVRRRKKREAEALRKKVAKKL